MSADENKKDLPLVEDTAIDLPLVNIDKTDVLGALFVHTDNMDELYHDALLKLQTWIINFAEEQIAPLRDSGCFSEEELEQIKRQTCVISPITLTLYLHWLQMEEFSRLTDSEKEKRLLEKLPDQFKARYRGNAACRNAREVSPEEELAKEENPDSAESKEKRLHMFFAEFIEDFGKRMQAELKEKGK